MSVTDVDVNDLTLTDSWQTWVAENKIQGVSDSRLIEILKNNGVEEALATREVAAASTDNPWFEAGRRVSQRLKKLESLLRVYSHLSLLTSNFRNIERKPKLSRAEFLESYYATNRPIILTGIMENWKALGLWSPEYFRSVCGDELIEVMTGRESDPHHEINLDSHRTQMTMRDFVDLVVNGGENNDHYLVANNFFLKREGVKKLLDDIASFPEYLDPSSVDGYCSLWFGPAGTITELHHDDINILMAQVYGHKRITLIPSYQLNLLYNNIGVYSEIKLENATYEEYPLFEQANPIELILKPGEVLFIPVGWWHHVRSLEVSITVSFINFVFPNRYEWHHPERV